MEEKERKMSHTRFPPNEVDQDEIQDLMMAGIIPGIPGIVRCSPLMEVYSLFSKTQIDQLGRLFFISIYYLVISWNTFFQCSLN